MSAYPQSLTVLCFPDLQPWQRKLLEPVLHCIGPTFPYSVVEVDEGHREFSARFRSSEVYWVWAGDWRGAVRWLNPGPSVKLLAAVMDAGMAQQSMQSLFFNRLTSPLPGAVGLTTFSPLSHRFFSEMEGLGKDRLVELPLPFVPSSLPVKRRSHKRGEFTVGTFASFNREANLNYLMNVAHYVCHRRENAIFRILGSGRLFRHLERMVAELELPEQVQVVQSEDGAAVSELDLFLYCPLRNDHFGNLYYPAAAMVPVIANELPGIESFIHDGTDGFIVPVNETKPMGELILRLMDAPELRTALGQRFALKLSERFAPSLLAEDYQQALFKHSEPAPSIATIPAAL